MWTSPDAVVARLRRQWDAGTFLTSFASGAEFAPIGVPLRGPGAGEIADRFAEVAAWTEAWQRVDPQLLRVEQERVGGRAIGVNLIPCRAWIDSYDQLWAVLKTGRAVRRFGELADATKACCPRLLPWMVAHPMQALKLEPQWADLVATVAWIDERQRPGMYLRQVDVPGVDTKFIEQHRGVLAELLDLQLDLNPARIEVGVPRRDFARRYLFRKKAEYARFRLPDAGSGGFSELTVRADELTEAPAGIERVVVAENEITYLALPLSAGTMAIFGGGYAVSALELLDWLAGLDLVYWGDIDTHGFAILNRLRSHFGHARSMLMDRATLLAHRAQWVAEPTQITASLDLLNPVESALYRELLNHTHAPSVRLEQERVSFALIEQALTSL